MYTLVSVHLVYDMHKLHMDALRHIFNILFKHKHMHQV